MKKIFYIVLFVTTFIAGSSFTTNVKAQSVSVNFSLFYNSLKPYGRWVNHPRYGQIWINNTRGFQPYQTGGHWAYTDYGWTWVSDYDWGWAPFHYGRWGYEPSYGWYWVPQYQWSPAWVAWRSDNDYYGWAPLSPGINISVGASFNVIPSDRWVFAPHQYITSPVVARYYVPRTRNVTIIRNTTIVNNVTVRNNVNYVSGPRREDVERVNHTKIQTLTVSNQSRAGKTVINNNSKTVNIYRPVINNEKVTVNDNDKTVINKNSNNKTVNKNSNNNTVNKNKTEVNNNKSVEKNNNVNKNNNNTTKVTNKPPAKQPTRPVNKPQQQDRPQQNKPVEQNKPAHQNKPAQQNVPQQQNKPAQQNNPKPVNRPAQQRPPQQNRPQPQNRPAQQRPPQQQPNKKPHDGAQVNHLKQNAQAHTVAKANTKQANKSVAAPRIKQDVAQRRNPSDKNNNK